MFLLTLEPIASIARCNVGLQELVADSSALTISRRKCADSTQSMKGICQASALLSKAWCNPAGILNGMKSVLAKDTVSSVHWSDLPTCKGA